MRLTPTQRLLLSQGILLLALPLMLAGQSHSVRLFGSVAFLASLVVALRAIHARFYKRRWIELLSLGILSIDALAEVMLPPEAARLADEVATLMLLMVGQLVVWPLVQHIIRVRRVTRDTVAIAVSLYLFLGLLFALVYEFTEVIWPGNFRFLVRPGDRDAMFSAMLYFSYCTLTTVGFGDISPVGPAAQALAIVEACTGVMYPSVVIAWLVGGALASRSFHEFRGPTEPAGSQPREAGP